jgi:hypothetical protein
VWLVPTIAFATVLAVALLLHGSGRLSFSADEAMVGLMANDIRAGSHPVFFQGSEYAGTIEPHAVALAFALFGPSPAVHKAVVALAYAVFAALLAAAAGVWFGTPAAVFTGLYVAMGPAYLLHKGLTSDGHYSPVLLVGAISLLLLALIAREAARGAGLESRSFFLGLSFGVGVWVSPLCVNFLIPVAVVCVMRPVRNALRLRHLLLAIGGLAVGSLPWWIRNVETGFASLRIPVLHSESPQALAERLSSFVGDGLPLLLGPAAIASGRSPRGWAVVLGVAAAIAVLAFAAWAAVKRATDPRVRAGLWAALALVLVSIGFVLFARGQLEPPGVRRFEEPRAVLPAYVGFAPVVGYGISRLSRRPAIALGLVAALIAAHTSGWAQMPKRKGLEYGDSIEVARVLEGLRRAGVRSVYANYWWAYPVTYFSSGEIIGSPFAPFATVRRVEDRRKVDSDPSPGFLLWPPERDQMDDYLRDGGFSFDRTELGKISLFAHLDPRALPVLRACLCIPPIIRPESISWGSAEGPRRVAAGETGQYELRVRNNALSPWPANLNVGYHWRTRDGKDVERNGLRTAVGPGPRVGQEEALSVRVLADVPPGTYHLTFDLVLEGVTWFEWKGVAPLALPVEVIAQERWSLPH